MSYEQRTAILAKCPIWLRLFVLLCADLAYRFSEALGAKLSDYNPDTRLITLRVKGGELHTLPVTDEIERIIAAIPEDTDPDANLIEALAGKPRNKPGVRVAWRKARKAAGVADTVNPHDLRRTAASHLWTNTHDIRAVQQLLGHQSLHSTARYIVDRDPANLRPLLEALKPITEVKQ